VATFCTDQEKFSVKEKVVLSVQGQREGMGLPNSKLHEFREYNRPVMACTPGAFLGAAARFTVVNSSKHYTHSANHRNKDDLCFISCFKGFDFFFLSTKLFI